MVIDLCAGALTGAQPDERTTGIRFASILFRSFAGWLERYATATFVDMRETRLRPIRNVRRMSVLLFVYWLAFVWVAIGAGHNPGFVMHPETVPYPFRSVAILCVFPRGTRDAVRLGAPNLRPGGRAGRYHRPSHLIHPSLLHRALILPAGITDMAGIFYVPAEFSLATLLLLAVWALAPRRRPNDG